MKRNAPHPATITQDCLEELLRRHGSSYQRIYQYADECKEEAPCFAGSELLRAEVRYAVQEEMAERLSDVVFRRCELGTQGHPGYAALRECAELMAAELGWSEERRQQELEEVEQAFPRYGMRS